MGNCVKLDYTGDMRRITTTFGFEFDKDDYDKIIKPASLVHKENEHTLKQTKNMEDSTMKKTTQLTKTTIWNQLYKHSPEENIEILKEWINKYKPTLKWAIPVISIYAAYRILNSKNSNLTVENIDSECKKKLGFNLDFLKDKKALNELMVLGGIATGAYVSINVIYNFILTTIITTKKKKK